MPRLWPLQDSLGKPLEGETRLLSHKLLSVCCQRLSKFQLPGKCCPLDCSWKGMRLDMHLQRSHNMKSSSKEYKDMNSKSKQNRKAHKGQPNPNSNSTTTSTTTTSTNIDDGNNNEKPQRQEHWSEDDGAEEEEDETTETSTSVDEEEKARFGKHFQPPTTSHALLKSWRSHMKTPDG